MPGYVENVVKDLDERIGELNDEVARLEAARVALTGASGRRGRPASNRATPSPDALCRTAKRPLSRS